MKTAAGFADAVHKCPQMTTAVLTKYTAVRSFYENMPGVIPLDYSGTGVCVGDLLEAYMEYQYLYRRLGNSTPPPTRPASSLPY